MTWHWPQWVILVLYVIAASGALAKLGEAKTDSYDLWDVLLPLGILYVLYAGGFFG